MSDVDFVIIKRGLFYRPNRQGYTGIREQAGRYTEDEARDHALNGECSFLPLDQAPEFLPAAHNDIVVKHLTNQRDTALTRIRELAGFAEQLREYTALKYAGDCKCGKCQLVPREFIDRLYTALSSKDQEKTNG